MILLNSPVLWPRACGFDALSGGVPKRGPQGRSSGGNDSPPKVRGSRASNSSRARGLLILVALPQLHRQPARQPVCWENCFFLRYRPRTSKVIVLFVANATTANKRVKTRRRFMPGTLKLDSPPRMGGHYRRLYCPTLSFNSGSLNSCRFAGGLRMVCNGAQRPYKQSSRKTC